MKIKKYEVNDMKEALRLIKQELGPDAVILTTRKIMKPAGLGLFPKPLLEVTAAIDYDKNMIQATSFPDRADRQVETRQETMQHQDFYSGAPLPPDPTRAAQPQQRPQQANYRPAQLPQAQLPQTQSPQTQSQVPPKTAYGYQPQSYNQTPEPKVYPYKKVAETVNNHTPKNLENDEEINFTRALLENRKKAEEARAEVLQRPSGNRVELAHSVNNDSGTDTESLAQVLNTMGLGSLAMDIGDIKKQLFEMKASLQEPVNMAGDLHPEVRDIYNIAIKNGLDELLAYRFLKAIEKSAGANISKAKIKNALMEKIAESIPVEVEYIGRMKGKVMGFVGPTGVGKTTTIAKIAAELALKQTSQRVCLITVDNFRVGAVEQLKTYAEIVNVPLYVASSAQDLERLLGSIGDQYDYILLDSTGRSPYDANKLNDTAQYLNAAPNIVPILVLSMAANHAELGEMYERYSGLQPQYIAFTKLDETRYFGPLANIPIKKKIPIILLSIGQSVPDDLEIPDGKKIARKLLQEIPVLWNDK